MCFFNRRSVWLASFLLTSLASSSSLLGDSSHSEEACPKWRFLAIKRNPDKGCPLVFNKQTSPNPIAGSTRFCFYEQRNEEPGLEALLRQMTEEEETSTDNDIEKVFTAMDKDCAVVGSLGDEKTSLWMQSWKTLEQHFDVQVGRGPLADPRGEVRLAVLDTQPKLAWETQTEGNSPHGWSLAHMARHLVCDGNPSGSNSCVAEVSTELALAWTKFNSHNPPHEYLDLKKGGYFGTIYDLAKVIDGEVAAVRGSGKRLVLNLSAGWDGRVFRGLETEKDKMPVPAQILYSVLEKAACEGVLVIAAAGNRLGGPSPETGLLLPAAWANRTVKEKNCEQLTGSDLPTGSEFPLVYAVGGVDSESNPLSNARQKGMPELAAYADHAVVEIPGRDRPTRRCNGSTVKHHDAGNPGKTPTGGGSSVGCPPTKTYTGSSVAAAVASATAAAVWSVRPQWPAGKVMETLYNSGSELALGADVVTAPPLGSAARTQIAALSPFAFAVAPRFCANPPCVRRICLRHALCEAQNPGKPRACLQETCPKSELAPLRFDFNPAHKIDVSDYISLTTVPAGCNATRELYRSPSENPPSYCCPSDQLESALARPWIGPQPQDPPCPNCTLAPPGTGGSGGSLATVAGISYTLYIEIDSAWSEPLFDPTLRLGDTFVSISLPTPGYLDGKGTLTVENIRGDLVQAALDASQPIVLEFVVCENPSLCQDPRSVENPVLVVQ